jgi:hypothetical protein
MGINIHEKESRKTMTTFLLILILVLLGYLCIVGAVLFDILSIIRASVESICDFVSRETAKDIADKLVKAGYVQVKKDK